MVTDVTTYSIREFKARLSEILRDMEEGAEVIITRRGKPCGKLTGLGAPQSTKASLRTLRGALSDLPDATYQDFLDLKAVWEPRLPALGEADRDDAR